MDNEIGLKRNTVELKEYSSYWKENAEITVSKLWDLLGNTAKGIEHIGSTSVEGLDAKPIIDIAIGVTSLEDIVPYLDELSRNGFVHVPERDSYEQVFLSCGNFDEDIRTHYIHVVIYEGREWKNYLLFRDKLNSDKKLKTQYQYLKRKLREEYPNDREAYTVGKAMFIEKVLETE